MTTALPHKQSAEQCDEQLTLDSGRRRCEWNNPRSKTCAAVSWNA